jgi:hypothetical protein
VVGNSSRYLVSCQVCIHSNLELVSILTLSKPLLARLDQLRLSLGMVRSWRDCPIRHLLGWYLRDSLSIHPRCLRHLCRICSCHHNLLSLRRIRSYQSDRETNVRQHRRALDYDVDRLCSRASGTRSTATPQVRRALATAITLRQQIRTTSL